MPRIITIILALLLVAALAPIEPVRAQRAPLAWSTFLGGALVERTTGVAVDPTGAVYVAGFTNSADLPTTPGVLQPRRRAEMEGFVAKFTPDGRLAYLTYLGGGDYDIITAIAVDASGAAYVAGRTASTDLPVTPGAAQPTYRGDFDGFIAKLAPDGARLAYLTYLGGRGFDLLNAIAVDPTGAVAVAGATLSTDIPTTPGAAQPAYLGSLRNGLVARLDPDGRRFSALTYLGGSGETVPWGVAADASGAAYIVGETLSTELPVSPTALQGTNKGGGDAFVAKLPPDGRGLAYATYLGGRGYDRGAAIAVDAAGAAYVTGYTVSSDFPVTAGVAQGKRQGNYDAFVVKLAPGGDSLAYGTFYGSSGNDQAAAIAVAGTGAAWVAGQLQPTDQMVETGQPIDLPGLAGGVQSRYGGGEWDAFVATISPDGRGVAYATLLGGAADDQAATVAVDPSGAAIVGGFTRSADFPVGAPWQPILKGEQDAFVTKLAAGGAPPATPPAAPPPVSLGDDCQAFAETGQAVCGPFKTYWNERGGLSQFGYPLSPALGERNPDDGQTYTVQYFERARFEYHPDLAPPSDVLLGLLGRSVTRGRADEPAFQAVADPGDGSWFPETGHTLRGRFRERWAATGGLAVYGYPISEEFQERNPDDGKTYTVQYFERNRLEYHPELAGTPFEVTLGQLGRQVYASRQSAVGSRQSPVASSLGESPGGHQRR